MKIEYEGRVWDLEPNDLTNKQAVKIREYTGLTSRQWIEAIEEGDDAAGDEDLSMFFRALDALYWLMLAQNGETVPISEVEYKIARFTAALQVAVAAEAKARKDEPDPTRPPAGSARSPAPPSPSSRRKTPGGRDG